MTSHRIRYLRGWVLLVAAYGIAACSGPEFTPAAQIASPRSTRNVLENAPRLVLQAEAGIYARGEQDDMLRREAELPGFGGFYISADRQVMVYMKPSARTPDALVRSTLYNAYVSRPEQYVRESMVNARQAQILVGQYTLSELIAIENAIAHSLTRIPGYTGVGTDIRRNRVILGLVDSSHTAEAMSAVASLGVPTEAVIPEVWGKVQFASNWNSTVRPTRAGIEMEILNRTVYSVPSGGSIGYNVFTNDTSTNYLLTAAHIVDLLLGSSGVTGDTAYQPTHTAASTPIGFVTNNPAWSTSCPTNPMTGSPYDLCPVADAMLISYANSVTGTRALGTSDYEGLNGGVGSQHIHGWYAISGVAIPEYLPASDTGKIHKSGFKTGTTTGGLVIPVVQLGFQTYWGVSGGSKWVLLTNVSRVDHMGWGPGDSGGPFFAEAPGGGSPYYALGIFSVGNSYDPTTGICTLGTGCQVYFTRWEQIESALGLGTLDPTTYP